jgi:parallel beta-helix repeat protein
LFKTRTLSLMLVSVLGIFIAIGAVSAASDTCCTGCTNCSSNCTNCTDVCQNVTCNAACGDGANVGQNVTQLALNDQYLNFTHANNTLLITNAGSATLNGTTTEGSEASIVNITSTLPLNQRISYGKGNIITINDPNDPLEYTFITQLANDYLMAKKFVVTGTESNYTIQSSETVYIGANMTTTQWNNATKQLGADAFNLISIANAWACGAPLNLLDEAQSTGKIVPGVISGYTMAKSMVDVYAPDTMHEFVVITNSGGYDDDAADYFMPWNYKYYAMNGVNPLESAYIYWSKGSATGTLVLMEFNNNLTNQFEKQTGITVVNGTTSEIKYTDWLINLLNTNPSKILTILKTASINQTDLNYLYGNSTTTGHGLSSAGLNYIMNLTNASTPFKVPSSITPINNYSQMENAGQHMAETASNILNSLSNSNHSQIAVVTAPIWATSDNYLISGVYDGISSVLNTDSLMNLMGIKNPYNYDSYVNSNLVAVFIQKIGVDSTGNILINLVEAVYNPLTNTTTYSNPIELVNDNVQYYDGSAGAGMFDMPAWLRTSELWGANASYSFMVDFEQIACCCWGPGIMMTNNNILSQLPNGPNESYIIIGLAHDGMSTFGLGKTTSGRMYDLDVSPSNGTFYTPGEVYNLSNFAGIVINWNNVTKTGIASLITFDSSILSTLQGNESAPYNQTALIVYYNDILAGKTKATVSDIASAFTIVKQIYVTQSDLTSLTAAGNNPVSYVENSIHTVLNVNPGDNVQSILNNATSGDTILFHDNNGTAYTYNVNLVINKTLNLITDGYVTLNAANTSNPVLSLTKGANGTSISGLDITGASGSIGINVNSVNKITLTNDNISGNMLGVELLNSSNNTITGNNITNSDNGLNLDQSNNNTITGNTLEYNSESGLIMQNSSNNIIRNNKVEDNNLSGMSINNATKNNITGNIITSNQIGVSLSDNSYNNTIQNNNIADNSFTGLNIIKSNNNIITNNTVSNDGLTGISIQNSNINTVNNNTIKNNQYYGIYLDNSNNTTIKENNITDNQYGISVYGTSNTTTIQFNSIIGNTNYGLIKTGSGNINATLNWWGCNTATNVAKQILNTGKGSITYNPWIILNITATPVNITVNKTSTITADLHHDSNGVYHNPVNGVIPYTGSAAFKTNLGSITNTNFTNSQAITTFKSGSLGIANITASVNGITVNTNITIYTPLKINTTNPVNKAINVSTNKTITVTFNENIKTGNNNIILENSKGTTVPFNESISGKTLTITPKTNLTKNTTYTLILHTGSVTDILGNPLALTSSNFTTSTA